MIFMYIGLIIVHFLLIRLRLSLNKKLLKNAGMHVRWRNWWMITTKPSKKIQTLIHFILTLMHSWQLLQDRNLTIINTRIIMNYFGVRTFMLGCKFCDRFLLCCCNTKWYSRFSCTRALQLLCKHSALLDSSSSEYQYRDEIVNTLLSYIFYDVEDAIWIKTLSVFIEIVIYN